MWTAGPAPSARSCSSTWCPTCSNATCTCADLQRWPTPCVIACASRACPRTSCTRNVSNSDHVSASVPACGSAQVCGRPQPVGLKHRFPQPVAHLGRAGVETKVEDVGENPEPFGSLRDGVGGESVAADPGQDDAPDHVHSGGVPALGHRHLDEAGVG